MKKARGHVLVVPGGTPTGVGLLPATLSTDGRWRRHGNLGAFFRQTFGNAAERPTPSGEAHNHERNGANDGTLTRWFHPLRYPYARLLCGVGEATASQHHE
jgi:hypothetical protein